MLTRIGNKVTVGRPLCNVLRIGRPLEGGGSFLRDWTVYGKSEVVGSSVLGVGDVYPWNQLFENGLNYHVSSTTSADKYSTTYARWNTQVKGGSKYLTLLRVANLIGTLAYIDIRNATYGVIPGTNLRVYNEGETVSSIWTAPSDSAVKYSLLRLYNTDEGMAVSADFTLQLFDLTAIFGAGNEPSTVDEFKAWLVKVGKMAKVTDDIPYFPHDAGSTFTSLPIVASSRNLWDEEWQQGYYSSTGVFTSATNQLCTKNFIAVSPNTTYRCNKTSGGTAVLYYKRDMSFISRSFDSYASFTTPADCYYIKYNFGTTYGGTYNHDITINIPDALGNAYTPHQSQRFPLVISSPLHGIGDVRDIMRYSDHGITRKYGVVDLGTLSWAGQPFGTRARFAAAIGGKAYGRTNCVVPIFTYNANVVNNPSAANINEWAAHPTNNFIYILVDGATYADAAAFKTAMSGVLLVYELATPTFEPVTLPKLPAYRDGTVLYTDTQVHGDTIAGEAPVGFSLLPPVTMTPPTGDADTNGQTDDTATE